MSIFGKIKDAIFGHKAKAQEATPRPSQPTPAPQPRPAASATATSATPVVVTETAPVSQVDVEHNLTELAGDRDLNWRTSIVDLMKVLGIDSSLDNRKELARELGYMGDLDGSAEMNIWLHKATMRALEENGGKVPPTMRD